MRLTFPRPTIKRSGPLLILFAIFIVALVLRVYGVDFGLPYAEEVDEPAIMDHALAMLTRGDWNPHWFLYPTFYIYAQSFVAWLYFLWAQSQGMLSSIEQIGGLDYNWRYIAHPDVYIWARTLTALVGASTVVVLYGAAARLYSRAVGLASAAILTFTFLHVQYSHFVRTDIPLTFFITLTLFFAARLLDARREGVRDYVLAGLGIGLTVASKYNGFLIALVVVAAHLARVRATSTSRNYVNPKTHLPLALSAVASLAAFFATNPFALLDWSTFWFGVHDDAQTYAYAGLQLENAWYYISYFMLRGGLGTLLTPLALAGLALSLVRRRAADIVSAIFPLGYFDFLLFWDKANIRSALPLTPFLALFAALALVQAIEFVSARWSDFRPYRSYALVALMLGLLISPAEKIMAEDARMARPTTRAIATQWAESNLPREARVLSEPEAIRVQSPIMIPPASLTRTKVEALQARGYDYVVAADDPTETPRSLDSSLTLIQTFPSTEPSAGPTIRIFQVPPRPLGLELVDAHFDRGKYAPGDRASLTLHWRTLDAFSENYVEFVRLLAPNSETAFEIAELPQEGNGRMKRWSAGRVITDTHAFVLPPDLGTNRYDVLVGFYREESKFALALRDANRQIVRALEIGSVKVARPLKPEINSDPESKLDARFSIGIKLRGYSLETETPIPGRDLELNLYWLADNEMQTSYTRFVHLLDSAGRLVAQNDQVPRGGSYPTSVWDPGETVSETIRLELPKELASGMYSLQVGWYEYPSLQRLTTEQGDDKVVLKQLQVRQ